MSAGLTIETASRSKWRDAVAQRALPIFFLLAFLLSWYPWFLALAQGRTSGPNPLGPFVAALIVAGIAEGWPGIRGLLARIVRGRIGLRWYAITFGLPIAVCAVAFAIMATFGQVTSAPTAAAWRELPERFIFIFLFIGLGEEPGWRGFALPRLQKNYSPLIASLILAPIWALWHLPLMGHEFPLPIIPAFLIALLAGTLIQTWLFNRTKGSVFAQMLFHAAVNTVGAGLVFPLFKGSAFVTFWYLYALLWLTAGAITVFLSGAAEAHSPWPRNEDRRARPPTPDRI